MSSRELKFLIQPNGDIHSRVNDRHRSTSSVNEEKHISEFAFNKKNSKGKEIKAQSQFCIFLKITNKNIQKNLC